MLKLTDSDIVAITGQDSEYINNKGARCYAEENYGMAVEYYHLAASMGNVNSISNLGYCYLYGSSIEQNTSLAIAYFKVASAKGDIDAAYKLGDIYGSDRWGMKDKELSNYHYRIAASRIMEPDSQNMDGVRWNSELSQYPSLCYALGREMSKGGSMNTDMELAYAYLKKAEDGYKMRLANGEMMYEKSYNGVVELLSDSQFDLVRCEYADLED